MLADILQLPPMLMLKAVAEACATHELVIVGILAIVMVDVSISIFTVIPKRCSV